MFGIDGRLVQADAGVAFAAPVARWGTVYGTLLNHPDALAALGEQVHAAPYQAPPRAPVLYIKPRNTLARNGEAVVVPPDVTELEVGATLGIVIGSTACRVAESQALACVAGYTVVNDLSIPHASFYRPSLRFKCRDGFCPIGPCIVEQKKVPDPNYLAISVAIDGKVMQQTSTAHLIRPVQRLLADVTEFMTLRPGDVLMVGVAAGAPRARAGQRAVVSIDGIGALETPLVAAASR
jgi:5-oxopent-3-ene-1,2,5-tricarboxylate decarboxylase / 2-hydroxyhepta-2,4-diene-1,7-dioate isomerase